jgi:hypothetical protein
MLKMMQILGIHIVDVISEESIIDMAPTKLGRFYQIQPGRGHALDELHQAKHSREIVNFPLVRDINISESELWLIKCLGAQSVGVFVIARILSLHRHIMLSYFEFSTA